jgi:hypothetical protein
VLQEHEGVEGEMKTVLKSCVEDVGRPPGIGFQEQVSKGGDRQAANSLPSPSQNGKRIEIVVGLNWVGSRHPD